MKITGNLTVANEILQRLQDVKVSLDNYLASDIKGAETTLKGIDFQCLDLAAIKHKFEITTDYLGQKAFYYNGVYNHKKILEGLIRNAPQPLDMSFAASDGFGYREIRD